MTSNESLYVYTVIFLLQLASIAYDGVVAGPEVFSAGAQMLIYMMHWQREMDRRCKQQ